MEGNVYSYILVYGEVLFTLAMRCCVSKNCRLNSKSTFNSFCLSATNACNESINCYENRRHQEP